MMQDIIEYVVKQLVETPESVRVSVEKTDDGHVFKIMVEEQDRGKVIGRQGQTIKALRMLISATHPDVGKVSVDVLTPAS